MRMNVAYKDGAKGQFYDIEEGSKVNIVGDYLLVGSDARYHYIAFKREDVVEIEFISEASKTAYRRM
jgi:hypothetical protein